MKKWQILATASLAALLTLAPDLRADQYESFDLAWSGDGFANTANATGQITLDISLINNPGETGPLTVTAFSITVTGASVGDGTFALADFNTFWLDTGGNLLNFNEQLVGQQNGGNPWDSCSNLSCGDFNFFSNDSAPSGINNFVIETNGDNGGNLLGLTSFAPASAPTPEPGSLLLLGSGLVGLFGIVRRRAVQQS